MIFFLAHGIEQMHSADIGEIIAALLDKIVIKTEIFISIIEDCEPKHHSPTAGAFEHLEFDTRAGRLAIGARECRLRLGCLRRGLCSRRQGLGSCGRSGNGVSAGACGGAAGAGCGALVSAVGAGA